MEAHPHLMHWMHAWKQGDEASATRLIEQFQPLLRNVAAKYHSLSYEDAYQEACLALLEAAKRFDETQGTPVLWYLQRMVHASVHTAMRRIWTYQRRMVYVQNRDEDTETDSWEELPDESSAVATAQWEDAFVLQHWMKRAKLSPNETLALAARLKGWSLSDLAAKHGVSSETAKTWNKRAVRKLRQQWERERD
ncbi:MAG: RNA polymerase sigma factor [Alicyclobacillaceae bacterium]|nr:RNA polymerase sigma factor [Alicyclobacillaceae bacterium]